MTDHLEGGPDCKWYKVKVTEELFEQWGLSVDWGKPDAEGFYTPTLRKEATAAARIAELEAAAREAADWLEARPDYTEGDAATSSRLRAALAPGTGEAG